MSAALNRLAGIPFLQGREDVNENLLSAGGFKITTVDHNQAVQSFQEALTGHPGTSLSPELPPLEVASSVTAPGSLNGLESPQPIGADIVGQMNGLMQSVMDVAMKLANPLGFINAICQFLIGLFMSAGAQFAQALPQIDLYNQAAQAALDSKKLIQP